MMCWNHSGDGNELVSMGPFNNRVTKLSKLGMWEDYGDVASVLFRV